MAQYMHKPVPPPVFYPFEAVLIEGIYYYAGPDGKKVETPQAEFEAEFDAIPLVNQR
jgi:hypothetical protein